jgi:hypothetical protein
MVVRNVAVFRGPDDLANDGGRFHDVIEAVEHHLVPEHLLDPRALEVIGEVNFHLGAWRSITV